MIKQMIRLRSKFSMLKNRSLQIEILYESTALFEKCSRNSFCLYASKWYLLRAFFKGR